MVTGCSLSSNDESAAVHQPTYRPMIGNLLYLTSTQPDIMHAVGIVGRFQANPKESHLQVVKIIFKYLQGTPDFGLWYPRDADLTLHAYTDADWQEVLMIEKELVVVHSIWVHGCCLGSTRNKVRFPYL